MNVDIKDMGDWGTFMQKEICGVVYDTMLSTIDKKFTYGLHGDPYGYEETLYITSDGHYFIYTNGGDKSKYPKEEIIPISRDNVKEWILSH
jgi:hypothetical protein